MCSCKIIYNNYCFPPFLSEKKEHGEELKVKQLDNNKETIEDDYAAIVANENTGIVEIYVTKGMTPITLKIPYENTIFGVTKDKKNFEITVRNFSRWVLSSFRRFII